MTDFSVIIPTYNSKNTICNAIQSVLDQSYNNFELIIVDDGSTDNTEELILKSFPKHSFQLIKQSNGGVGTARNAGLKLAKGKFIVFLDSDDEFKSELLNDYMKIVKTHNRLGLISCGYIINGVRNKPKLDLNISSFKYSNLTGTFAINKDVIEAIQAYDINLKQSENWEMIARALEYCEKNNFTIEHIDQCNLIYHHQKTPAQTKERDRHRAEATFYLHEKYKLSGILHFRKDKFLIASIVNYTRSGDLKKARKILFDSFKSSPSFSKLLRILIFEIPYLRNKKWLR